tara:strand:- start:115 stop:303 length:189 start_codon:yes stop_codon:yes gene_type:complete
MMSEEELMKMLKGDKGWIYKEKEMCVKKGVRGWFRVLMEDKEGVVKRYVLRELREKEKFWDE